MNKFSSLFLFLISVGVTAPAFADQEEKPALVSADKNNRIKIDFEDELVKGKFNSPEMMYINTRKNNNFKKLIKIRENFNSEMDKSKNAFKK